MKLMTFSVLFLALLSVGCADEQYFSGNGSEALVYQETHSIELNNSVNLQQQISSILQEVQQVDSAAYIRAEYKNTSSKRALKQALDRYTVYHVRNYRVDYQYNPQMDIDIKLDITMTKLKTESCRAAEISKETWQRNCFVESSRMQQVVDKSSLIGSH